MTEQARSIAHRIEALFRELAKSPSSEWVRLDSEAKKRGYSTTAAFRRWCERHLIELRSDGNSRVTWVRPADVDAVISGLPKAVAGSEIDAEIDKA